jgi:hypothetical protein
MIRPKAGGSSQLVGSVMGAMMWIRSSLLASVASIVFSSALSAQTFTTPNVITTDGPVSVSVGGLTFTNQGMVGAGRLSATSTDFLGDTLGSFSGLAIDPRTWRMNANGSFSGATYGLPDRGLNDPNVTPPIFSDYAGRVFRFGMTFTPYSGPNLPAATSSQSQVQLTQDGGIVLRDPNGQTFTGVDPLAGTTTLFGRPAPSPASGPGAGKIALDSEAITFRRDRSFYIGDEYTPGIYYFDPNGKLLGTIPVPNALVPRTNGAINFTSLNPIPARRLQCYRKAQQPGPGGARGDP